MGIWSFVDIFKKITIIKQVKNSKKRAFLKNSTSDMHLFSSVFARFL